MLLDTGLRASELVGLTMDNINLEDSIVKVFGKGSKERLVPIGSRVQRTLRKYIHKYRPQPASPLYPATDCFRQPLNYRLSQNDNREIRATGLY